MVHDIRALNVERLTHIARMPAQTLHSAAPMLCGRSLWWTGTVLCPGL